MATSPYYQKGANLFLQTEFLDERVVVALVGILEVMQMRPSIGNHLKKPAAGMNILRIFLQMLGEIVDPARKKRNLNIRRAGVSIVASSILNNCGLFLRGKHG